MPRVITIKKAQGESAGHKTSYRPWLGPGDSAKGALAKPFGRFALPLGGYLTIIGFDMLEFTSVSALTSLGQTPRLVRDRVRRDRVEVKAAAERANSCNHRSEPTSPLRHSILPVAPGLSALAADSSKDLFPV